VIKKDHIYNFIIVVLVIIVLLQRCGKGNSSPCETKVTRDTIWIHKDSTIYSKPQIIKTIPYSVPIDRWSTEYLPDTNYSKLLQQYQSLVVTYLSSNLLQDSIKIDSIGYIKILDTISANSVKGRSTSYNLKYPVVKETLTIQDKPKREMYFGIGLGGDKVKLIDNISLGLMYKDRKDRMFGASVMASPSGIEYGVQSYWKIRLKK
jgi:hypothetical protein